MLLYEELCEFALFAKATRGGASILVLSSDEGEADTEV